jgi:alkylation response protein AidB-like acyl-CoA dehydrogenase
MATKLLERIEEMSQYLREQAVEAEEIGQLPDETAKRLRELGIMRMTQPKSHGGLESHPAEFLEAIMALGTHCGATGWVSGIVGVHPAELALMDPRLLDEVWGDDPDTWIASPYTPVGLARPVDGGYQFSGRWGFSSGTDHCTWAHLGGLVTDADGVPLNPGVMVHLALPRSDYEIIEDSWNVAGLKGTGSKDVAVHDVFVPDYRVVEAAGVFSGEQAKVFGADASTLYRMPWSAVFPNAITSAIIGICEGALAAHLDYQRGRVNIITGKSAEDPFAMEAIGMAASEIRSARVQVLDNVNRMWDIVDAGGEVPFEQRAAGRRDQVRCAWRAVEALDLLMTRSGGTAMRTSNPMQRLWRDAHMGLNHAINMASPVLQFYGSVRIGADLTTSTVAMTV